MTNDELARKIEDIKEEFHSLGIQISELASMPTERLREYKDEAVDEVKAFAKEASQKAEKQAKAVDEYTRDNPWIVIAGVSAVSLLIGALLFHGKSKK